MLKTLLKKQITEIFRGYFYNYKTNKKRSALATAGYIVLFTLLMVGLLGGMFGYLAYNISTALAAAGVEWLYFTLMGLIAIVMGTFGSVFNTYAGLYLAKDNDLLLSMPIPANIIIISRLLSVYIMGLMYSGVVMIPAMVVYFITVSAGASTIFGSVMLMLDISVFVLTLSCALGWVVAKISLKLKNRSFITVIVSIVFMGIYYFVYFKAQDVINDLVMNAAIYGEKIKAAAYPAYLMGKAGTGDIPAVLAVTAAVAALFALMWVLISRSFIKIATSAGSTAKKKYKEKAARVSSAESALLRKEFGRFFGSANYMLNCGMGILMLAIFGGALLIKGSAIFSALNGIFAGDYKGAVPVLICSAVCAVASMNDMAAPSVSLEGKNLWLIQSLPVTPWQVLRAKLLVQLILTAAPVAFCILCVCAVYPISAGEVSFIIAYPLIFTVFSALSCLTLGLKMANLTWTSEITPIKQSGAVGLALITGPVYSIIVGGGYFLFGYLIGFPIYMGAWEIITAALCAFLYAWLKKKGTAVFTELK